MTTIGLHTGLFRRMKQAMDEAKPLTLEPLGFVRSCFTDKFGTPRQPGLCPNAWGELHFLPPFRNPDFIRGIEAFSHIWIVFGFHSTGPAPRNATVRPPRLGGNERTGVFASRSNFRPNPIGLSLARLESVGHDTDTGPVLHLGGIDILDGSPVYDVKPYLPYADALPDASAGFAAAPIPRLTVECSPDAETALAALPPRTRALIHEALALDPRPAVQSQQADRVFATRMAGHEIRFTVRDGVCTITGIG